METHRELEIRVSSVRATVDKLHEIGNSPLDIHENTGLPMWLIFKYIEDYESRRKTNVERNIR